MEAKARRVTKKNIRARGPYPPVFPVKKRCNGNYTLCQTNGNRKNKDRLGGSLDQR